MDEDILEKVKVVKAELEKEKYLSDTALDPVRTHTDEAVDEIKRLRVSENNLYKEIFRLREVVRPLEEQLVLKSDTIEQMTLKAAEIEQRLLALVGQPTTPEEEAMSLIERVEAGYAKAK